jgi:5-methylcytosine-specific restriction protein A
MKRAARVCSVPGCSNLVWGGDRRCTGHAREQQQRQDARRPTAAQRGYDANWRRIRKAFLEQHPLCVDCDRPATEVDHILPLAAGGTNDPGNLQARCKSHHSKKTAKEDGGFGNPKTAGVGAAR